MRPIKTLFLMLAFASMLVCSMASSPVDQRARTEKVVGVELRTCTGDAYTMFANIDSQNFFETIQVLTYKPENPLIFSAIMMRPEQIDFGNYSKETISIKLNQKLAYNNLVSYNRAKSHQIGYSCGGQGDATI